VKGYNLLLASDVVRDGLGLELMDENQNFIAEVFRCDADHSVTFSGKLDELPLEVLDWFLSHAKERLDPFEDGSPLNGSATIGRRCQDKSL